MPGTTPPTLKICGQTLSQLNCSRHYATDEGIFDFFYSSTNLALQELQKTH